MIPAIGYFLAFSFHRAYFAQYGIPEIFVRVDLTSLLVFSSAVLGVGYAFYYSLGDLISLEASAPELRVGTTRIKFYGALVGLMIFTASILEFSIHSFYVIYPLSILVVTILLDVVSSRVNRKRPPERTRLVTPWEILSRSRERYGNYFAYLIVFVVGVFLAPAIGTAQALRKANYIGLVSSPDSVLVAVIDGKAISAFYDPCTMKVTREFTVSDLAGKEGSKFEPRVGRRLNF